MKKRTIVNAALKKIKNTVMSNESKDRDNHADTIIRNHVIWSMGAGLIPVLIADIFAVSALQLDMIRQMCKIYDVDFKETQGKAVVTSLTSTTLARLGAGSIIKLIPGVGSVIGGATVSVFAGASTYALGEVFKSHFSSGGTILDFDPDRLRKYYKEKFEKGKNVAKEMNKKAKEGDIKVEEDAPAFSEPTSAKDASPPPVPMQEEEDHDDVLGKLRELGDLKASGVITDEEFEKMKKKLIDEF
ncbi:MAG: hypothetical protein ACI8P3_001827 [Saprospiraceae bacterium]|jgi:uncharacterized protein (DUF697 family)